MKKIIYTILGVFASFGVTVPFTSCADYLDVDNYFEEMLSVDSAFSRRVYVEGWLAAAYRHMDTELSDFNMYDTDKEPPGFTMFASDEILSHVDLTKKYQNGEYSSNENLREDKWKRTYEPIRKASTFIQNVHKCNELTSAEVYDFRAIARFLRAYCYWTLIKAYGPVPLVPENGLDVSLSYEDLSLPRVHADSIFNFISKELVLAAQSLPLERTANNLGKPTKGAALAARARTLLWAASPLYNGNVDFFNLKDNEGRELIAQTEDVTKWARAAAAAKEVMMLKKGDMPLYNLHIWPTTLEDPAYERPPLSKYSDLDFPEGWQDINPYLSYRNIFNGTVKASENPEAVFVRPSKNTFSDLASRAMPKDLLGGNEIGVTLKMVDAYRMNDGRTITEAGADYRTKGFTSSNDPTATDPVSGDALGAPFLKTNVSWRYANREPRFYASIAFPGAYWEAESTYETKYKNKQVFYYKETESGKGKFGYKWYNPTGIGMMKYNHPEDAKGKGGYIVQKTEISIRYAEVLLWYAEALNELPSGAKYTFTGWDGEPVEVERTRENLRAALKPIRMRAGLPDFTDAVYDNPAELKTQIKLERQVELFAEGRRYYDLRRWKDAAELENAPLMAYNLDIPDVSSLWEDFYEPTVLTDYPKSFSNPKMYFWPMPKYELNMNVRLTQTPGW